ncbi:hypothetical protein H6P81_012327 [Aristolochia fimbriata]|uniref:Uncharacterized protein n=1 Tax=Aristolochia fimbriata TaxID=158543 RepID=A0AAV7ED39_ARIFI|nr:hypothetical protein H6P81_012327 [Aristolochia fimbriata]
MGLVPDMREAFEIAGWVVYDSPTLLRSKACGCDRSETLDVCLQNFILKMDVNREKGRVLLLGCRNWVIQIRFGHCSWASRSPQGAGEKPWVAHVRSRG